MFFLPKKNEWGGNWTRPFAYEPQCGHVVVAVDLHMSGDQREHRQAVVEFSEILGPEVARDRYRHQNPNA